MEERGREREYIIKERELHTHTHLLPESVIDEVTSEVLLVLKLLNWDGQLRECRTHGTERYSHSSLSGRGGCRDPRSDVWCPQIPSLSLHCCTEWGCPDGTCTPQTEKHICRKSLEGQKSVLQSAGNGCCFVDYLFRYTYIYIRLLTKFQLLVSNIEIHKR